MATKPRTCTSNGTASNGAPVWAVWRARIWLSKGNAAKPAALGLLFHLADLQLRQVTERRHRGDNRLNRVTKTLTFLTIVKTLPPGNSGRGEELRRADCGA